MRNTTLFVDGHVHLHRPEDTKELLKQSSENFRRAAAATGQSADYGLLMLADPRNVPGFDWLRALPDADPDGPAPEDWSVVGRPDETTLHVRKAGEMPLAILGGRQVISGENLEILVFPGQTVPRDGDRTQDILGHAKSAGGIAILAWGVGKWLGGRARIVRDALETAAPGGSIAVGDNGGRPALWRRISLLSEATSAGFVNIAGTDPLPLEGEIARVGSFGVWLEGTPDKGWGYREFRQLLTTANLHRYGPLLGPLAFFWKQLALRRGHGLPLARALS